MATRWPDRYINVAVVLSMGLNAFANAPHAAEPNEREQWANCQLQMQLLGKDYDVRVEEYDSFGESAFNLTLKERCKKAGK